MSLFRNHNLVTKKNQKNNKKKSTNLCEVGSFTLGLLSLY